MTPSPDGDPIVVSAVTLRDADGRILTVRKRGTSMFMQPGGKPEGGESAVACALREVHEELGLGLSPEELEPKGVHRTDAANEAGRTLVAFVFEHPHLRGSSAPEIIPAAEIEEVRWLDPREPLPTDAAPLLHLVVRGGHPRG
ncbi:NUDIX hydrolase [Janibacter corallicola]|uniref:NUDIX hydrolase n=1 Tax=Janibacter corallicola TaxID=415212 RepID=UPI00082B54AE|nr:NUDIX domain-containing protein [Janibacter corallicola]